MTGSSPNRGDASPRTGIAQVLATRPTKSGLSLARSRQCGMRSGGHALGTQRRAAHLPGLVSQRSVDELDRARQLVLRQALGRERQQLLLGEGAVLGFDDRVDRCCPCPRRGARSRTPTSPRGAPGSRLRPRPDRCWRRPTGSCPACDRRGRGTRRRRTSPCRRATPNRPPSCAARLPCSGRSARRGCAAATPRPSRRRASSLPSASVILNSPLLGRPTEPRCSSHSGPVMTVTRLRLGAGVQLEDALGAEPVDPRLLQPHRARLGEVPHHLQRREVVARGARRRADGGSASSSSAPGR